MIKFVLAALWICAVTVGTVLFSFQFSQARNEAAPTPAAFFGGLEHIATDMISIPVVRKGGVDGYFLTKLSYSIDSKKLKTLSVPVNAMLVDEIFSYLYANPQIDYETSGGLDVVAFRESLRDAINKRVGDELIHDVFIDQADYLSKAEIRANTPRQKIGLAEPAAKAEKPAPKGH
ncbi:hypothetical protein [Nitratireductor indicus]|uniref:Flagellar basal body-associated protein FliL n=1 Tax=Nitratireductor indicus C115 TaxID=1231190 RepID=K2NUV1_9HYPH|nr:hypothetical protein [Nitratireductor indicus]EKF41594.1 hypothetical protein NA8A_15336 [Nitratireductor indicus C115]MDS1136122.1 hypothetical protein [Nitratireductor indicus]SFQ70291.1 hypothetical protein SAMN05216176_110130 [Nitratireductor indicus]